MSACRFHSPSNAVAHVVVPHRTCSASGPSTRVVVEWLRFPLVCSPCVRISPILTRPPPLPPLDACLLPLSPLQPRLHPLRAAAAGTRHTATQKTNGKHTRIKCALLAHPRRVGTDQQGRPMSFLAWRLACACCSLSSLPLEPRLPHKNSPACDVCKSPLPNFRNTAQCTSTSMPPSEPRLHTAPPTAVLRLAATGGSAPTGT